jgi:hypothetical protein
LPIGIFLTYKAATDSALFNPDAWMKYLNRARRKIIKVYRRVVSNKLSNS